jgi:Predicted membrane protein (DUF2306)
LAVNSNEGLSLGGLQPIRAGETALRAAARLWFLAAVIGQWVFFYYIAAFYGPSTFQGNFQAWTKNTYLFKGYVAGDTVGNLFFGAHALLAAVIAFGGTLQLIPQIRSRAIAVHRWNGRLFLTTAFAASLAGLYLVWVRGDRPSLIGALALSLNAALIIVFGVMAWRAVIAGEISAHRRWALRTYLVANAQWFIRVGIFAWIIVNGGPVGMTDGSDGPFNYFVDFACYLLPLAVLQLYLRAKESAGPPGRFAMALGLVMLTALMGVGIVGLAAFVMWPLLARNV